MKAKFNVIYMDEAVKFLVTFSTIVRAFRAMDVKSANLDLGSLGKVALW